MPDAPLVVVTPWFPTEAGPYDGIFVQEAVAALGHPPECTLIIHLHNVPPDRVSEPTRHRTPLGEVLHIPVGVASLTPRDEMARAQRRALEAVMPPELHRAPVVHAHVGMPGGWAVAGVLPPSTRLVTTEHATYLPIILRTPAGQRMYGDVLARSSALLMVGEREARSIRQIFPAQADKVGAIGNPVREDRFVLRPTPVDRLDRWVYVGNLIPRKGVDRVIRSLAQWRASHPDRDTRLRLVGNGPQREELAALAAQIGVDHAVDFTGPAAPEDLPKIFADSDVLVHLSSHETFGLTTVEAAMTGLPVLVTACGGPEETLADAAAAGLVRFVPVGSGTAPVVEGLSALESTMRSADYTAAREVLVSRYGNVAFGRRLRRALAGEPLDEPAPPSAPMVLGLVASPRASRRIAHLHQEVLRQGGRAALITSEPGDRAATDRRVEVIDLCEHGSRTVLHAMERVLLWWIPTGLLRAVRKMSYLVGQVPGPQRRLARRGVNAMSTLLSRYVHLASAVHARVLHRFVYSWTDPWRNAAYVTRRRMDEVRALAPDIIVLGDQDSLPLGWRLAREFPEAQVMSAPTEATIRRLVRGHAPSAPS